MKATKIQLPKVIKYLEEDTKAIVKKYFNKDMEGIDGYKIYKFILLSNRNVSGLNIDDVAVRDIYSLERILEAGFLEIGQLSDDEEKKEIINNEKIYYWKNKKSFQECDLINYHSKNSRFFELFERMIFETSREYSYNKYILRDQVFSSDLSVDQLDKIKKKLKSTDVKIKA
jgi:hypothetical protein